MIYSNKQPEFDIRTLYSYRISNEKDLPQTNNKSFHLLPD